MSFHKELFIDGQYAPSSTGATMRILNPYDNSVAVEDMHVASEADVERAVRAAKDAFPSWKETPATVRGNAMVKFAELLEADAENLARLEAIAMGQPISIAKRMILASAGVWRYYAGYAGKVAGEAYSPEGDGTYKIVQYEPLGVCAGICAWNASHILSAWKIAPAMAAGNTFVLKSSEKSPISLAQYGALIQRAGFPAGVINILTGDGKIGALLSSHMEISKIAFTGSTAAGRAVQIAAANSNLKKVTLELGGKSPALVFDDADVPNAVIHCCDGFLRNSGQICFASSRVLVHANIAVKFMKKLRTAFEEAAQRMGDPQLLGTDFGPLADQLHFNHVMELLHHGEQEGLEALVGGEQQGTKGLFVQPTVLLGPDRNSKLWKEEIFGPVIVLKTFRTEEEAIELANDTPYGLGSSIYTSDIGQALRVAGKVQAGAVGINGAFATSQHTPFGGWKQSGYGRELGLEGIKNYLQSKTIHVNMNVTKR
ncbi:aldehyde dehydrogenase [Aspergillus costaricaensis CBS 115574]|uniref:Aldehyde dehydrogenase n=1 Tax=Aspergillus costaricaensis CBS 115574 TaxID=1448317 RepID=A0ACD1I7R6_9EURO|nr:aldehyde dehydrogenase [Aspergillus costaricaensis CBS 115574]RAK86387.1 aldehyde dehydrogenase [Aspergillus costaricaensis CBS 115574]